MSGPKILRRTISWLTFLFVAYAGSLFAQTDTEYWPEVQFYHKLNEQFRVRIAAGATRSEPLSGYKDRYLESDLDVGFKNIVGRKRQPDEHKGKYLSMRFGYSYHENSSDKPPENRVIAEVTSRFPLPGLFLASDRNRLDFRSIGGDDSKRYRNRVRLEREYTIGHLKFSPYGEAEFYYDSRVDGWNRNEYTFGSEFPIRKRFVLEFYYAYQNNKGSGTTDVNGLATVLQIHW